MSVLPGLRAPHKRIYTRGISGEGITREGLLSTSHHAYREAPAPADLTTNSGWAWTAATVGRVTITQSGTL